MIFNNLKDYKVFLASGSPRRKELLSMTGVDFLVDVRPDLSEDFPLDMPVYDVPAFLALKKQQAYEDLWSQKGNIVITADTIVAIGNEVINKPDSRQQAIDMIKKLSGTVHEVITGVMLKSFEKDVVFSSVTHVWFKSLSDSEIIYYVDNYKPFDKAGAYGIQEWIGLIGINRIEGSYFNVMGLPVDMLYDELVRF